MQAKANAAPARRQARALRGEGYHEATVELVGGNESADRIIAPFMTAQEPCGAGF